MEIEEYVLHKEKKLARGRERIKDFHAFDFNYIPEKPFMRDEVKPVVKAVPHVVPSPDCATEPSTYRSVASRTAWAE